MPIIKFKANNAVGEILQSWWKNLENDRAGRAILRRAASPTEVALTESYQRLFRRLRMAVEIPDYDRERLAAVAGLLAHVVKNESRSIPEAMSARESGERPVVSELRFLRLLASPDIESLYTGMRRILPLMNHQADILALANDVLSWGDGVKKNWAYDYRWPEKATT
jgi:CRISPR system Cascade subunit CasB